MNLCYLGLGSNQKSPERQIRQAVMALKTIPDTAILKISNLYWSTAWGLCNQQDFCNVVVELTTRIPPVSLLKFCKQIEQKQGRVRTKRWGPRTIDIDILLYGQMIINSKKLTIPHPHIVLRDFVRIPLLEINPLICIPNLVKA